MTTTAKTSGTRRKQLQQEQPRKTRGRPAAGPVDSPARRADMPAAPWTVTPAPRKGKRKTDIASTVEGGPTSSPPVRVTASEPSRGTSVAGETKKAVCIALLSRPGGASLQELQAATGWQAHSVRGFLSGAVRGRMGRGVSSEKTAEGERRYRITPAGAGA